MMTTLFNMNHLHHPIHQSVTLNCNNCGKYGHLFHQCKLPITSYGIVAFRYYESKYYYLMIRRKDSFGYIEFIRGKYSLLDIFQIQKIVDEMSLEEKTRILERPFEELWIQMWGNVNIQNSQYKNEECMSKKKFEMLKFGIEVNGTIYTLQSIIQTSSTTWDETEWEFPKGRRNPKERDLECSLREFEEETGISKKNICVVENIMPMEEIFIGSNCKTYKHKYFLAYIENNHIDLSQYQDAEVSRLEWKTIDECLKSIRPYNLEKKELIKNVDKILEIYRLYV